MTEPLLDAFGRVPAGRRTALGLMAGGALAVGGMRAAPAQAPKRGGRIRVSGTSTSTADTLDPAKQ